MLVVVVVPATSGLFVAADRVIEAVAVENVKVVLVELVVEVTPVDEAKVVVVVETSNMAVRTSLRLLVTVTWYGPGATVLPTTKLPVNIPPVETVQLC